MSKNLLEAAERITDELTAEERMKLLNDLAQRMGKDRRDRWTKLFASIDARVRRYGAPPYEEILRVCREVRRERAARRRT